MLAAYTDCFSALTSIARVSSSMAGVISIMRSLLRSSVAALLDDELGVQGTRALDSLQDRNDVARGGLDALQRRDQLADGCALRQADGRELRFGDVHRRFRHYDRANFTAWPHQIAVRLRHH